MIEIDFVPANEIKVRHRYLPRDETASKKYNVHLKTNEPVMKLFRNKDNKLLLYRGLDIYNALKVIRPDKPVPCYIYSTPINLLDWTFTLLNTCFAENVYFQMKYEYIMLSLKETNQDVDKIATAVGCPKKEIKKYVIDEDVPDRYKELAFKYDKQTFVNEICRDTIIPYDHKLLLYKAIFQKNNTLTKENHKTFRKFIKFGYKMNPNAANALTQLNKVVDKNRAWQVYWDQLNNI